jgi:hypothetical protein
VSKKATFSRRGAREGHAGRHTTPVVLTAYTKAPLAPVSRRTTASQREAVESKRRLGARCGQLRLQLGKIDLEDLPDDLEIETK